MKILVAPNSFKESLNSTEVAHHIAKGLQKVSRKFKITELPLADGGTGTSYIMTKALDGEFVSLKVTGPTNNMITATYGVIPKQRVAIVELAEAAGLKLIPKKERNPLITTTKGVGELILDAVNNRYRKIILGIGDSTTIDCGVGALSVLGARFLDRKDEPIELNCRGLIDLRRIDTSQMPERIRSVKITIASDVKNILTGRYGVLVYAKQKGAKRATMPLIHKALKTFKKVVLKQYQIDLDKIPGSGAAGGIGGAFVAVMKSEMISGFGLIKELVYFEDAIKACDLVITGEGRVDKESFYGKTLKRVVDLAYIHKKPVILICGSISRDAKVFKKYRVLSQYSLVRSSRSLNKAMANAPKLLEELAIKVGKTLLN